MVMRLNDRRIRRARRCVPAAVVLAAACLVPAPAAAYLGPGAGLSAIGSVLALVAAVVVAVLGFLWFPIKRLLRGRCKRAAPDPARGPDAAEK